MIAVLNLSSPISLRIKSARSLSVFSFCEMNLAEIQCREVNMLDIFPGNSMMQLSDVSTDSHDSSQPPSDRRCEDLFVGFAATGNTGNFAV